MFSCCHCSCAIFLITSYFVHRGHANFDLNRYSNFTEYGFQLRKRFEWLKSVIRYPPPDNKFQQKFDYSPLKGLLQNVVFSLEKGLNGQNHSSPDSNHQIKEFPFQQNFSFPFTEAITSLFKAIRKTLQDMEQEQNGIILLFKLKLGK